MRSISLRKRIAASLERGSAWLSELSHKSQQRLAFVVDIVLCALASWGALALRLGFFYVYGWHYLIVLALALLIWFPVAAWRGVYQSILRYAGGRTMAGLAIAGAIMAVAMSVVLNVLRVDGLPRTVGVIQPMIFVALLGAVRLFVRFVLVDLAGTSGGLAVRRVMIYGAGRAGQQLALSLRHEKHIMVAGYLDDDGRLRMQRLDGLRVWSPSDLDLITSQLPVDEVLLAMPNIGRARRREIVEALQHYHVAVRALPSTAKIIDGDVSITDLRPVSLEDLLGRDMVPADTSLLERTITGKTVMVTGAGGSIGSELSRQIAALRPDRFVLVEQSEYALYTIDEELRRSGKLADVEIVTELGNVADETTVDDLFKRHKPQTVFHAAAYKHVPLVEMNPIAGASNNILSTLFLTESAQRYGVERFILISTDKAVRPTNVMGATKRVCELILQARAALSGDTTFAMVRFGNVLGSSGSVVPKFAAQIAAGGPVTLTHKDVTRYFMTIPEAAQLVIQAGAMAEGGDVFVLDMGQPVRIYDLAHSMIELSGLSVRDEGNPSGDVEIVEIGLRPGEKKYEELLIGDNPEPTDHPRIVKAHEDFVPWNELEAHLAVMQCDLEARNSQAVNAMIRRLVPDFKQQRAGAE